MFNQLAAGRCECRAPLRCAMPERPALQRAGNGRRAVPDARRRQHGAENRHRLGTVAQGALAAWATLRRVAGSGAGTRRGTGGTNCAAPAVGLSLTWPPRHMRPSCVWVGRRTSRTLRTRSSHLYIFGTAKFPRVQIGSPKRPPCPNVCAIVNGIASVPHTFATRQTAVGDFPLRRASLMPPAILPSKRLSQLPNL